MANRVKKIAVIGGESTGKSTLCEQLAAHYHTVWVKEYAREYLEGLDRPYNFDDLLLIAKGQLSAEKEILPLADRYLFCDTTLDVIHVWSEHRFGECDAWVLKNILDLHYDGYILTAPDLPWQPDKLREHREPEMRDHFFKCYKDIVQAKRKPYCIVKGNVDMRLKTATSFLENIFGQFIS